MGFSGSILEYTLIPLTLTAAGVGITYNLLRSNESEKVHSSVIDPNSKNKKKAIEIEYDQQKDKTEVEESLKQILVISEKITRDPLKTVYSPKPSKQQAIISYVLEPTEDGWE